MNLHHTDIKTSQHYRTSSPASCGPRGHTIVMPSSGQAELAFIALILGIQRAALALRQSGRLLCCLQTLMVCNPVGPQVNQCVIGTAQANKK